jgi:nucleotide-binding universal stress UspA family protein
MKKILVAYDGGRPARRALELAAELAQLFDAKVGVVSVSSHQSFPAPVDPWDDEPILTAELIEARNLLAEHGLEAELHEPMGDAAGMIERIAETGNYDMIVVGSRGLGSFGRILQGSVSGHVAAHASATVVVAR